MVVWAGGLYLLTVLAVMLIPGTIYNIQSRLFKLERRDCELVIYGYMALFKILFIVFVVSPYLALCSMV